MGVTRRISPGGGEPIRLLEALRQGGLQ
jgi:hypothetical protein